MNEIASRYANALYSLALENNKLDKVTLEIKELLEVLNQSDDLIMLLSNEFLSIKERIDSLNKILKGCDEDIIHLIDIVIKNHRVNLLKDIFLAFVSEANNYKGVKEGLLYASYKLDKKTVDKIQQAISKKEGCPTYLKLIVDQNLIGGFRVVINDHIYDSSIISQIQRMKSKLLRNEG